MAPQTQSPTDYSPLSPTPYQAPQLPEITAPPQRPAQETQQPPSAPSGPQVARSGGGLATVAFGLDSILKGYMRGKEQAQQQNYLKAKRLADGQRYAYEDAAQRYVGLVQSGTASPEEVQKADLAQRAAYAAWYQTIGNYMGVNGPQKAKKSKTGSKPMDEKIPGGPDPMQMITSQDPQVKAQGMYMLGQKIASTKGTPANIQALQFGPEYQAQRKLFQGQQANAASEQQLTGMSNDSKLEFARLEKSERDGTITAPDKAKLDAYRTQTQTDLAASSKPTPAKPGEEAARAADAIIKKMESDPKYKPTDQEKSMLQMAGFAPSASGKTMMDEKRGLLLTINPDGTITPHRYASPLPTDSSGGNESMFDAYAKDISEGRLTLAQVPEKGGMRNGVELYMSKHGFVKPDKETVADLNAQNAMKDVIPVIDDAIKHLEPHKDEGGWTDAIKQKVKWWGYKAGVAGTQEQDNLKQLLGFVQIAGASPWSKVGRGKYIFEQTQAHLPSPSDSPELAYNKLQELKKLYSQELSSASQRMGRGEDTSAASGGGGDAEKTVKDAKGNEIKVKVVNGKWVNSASGKPIE